jgi:NTP pyrophosphatase (non-canonical NTP hydrolase)
MKFNEIRQWAEKRALLKKENSFKQLAKLLEEAGETSSAIIKNQPEKIKDGIGDCVVVLTILAAQNGLKIEDCIEAAYNEIKDRQGESVNGLFLKKEA